MITTTLLAATSAVLLLALCLLALLWRAELALHRRRVARLRDQIRAARAERDRDVDEWRQEAARLNTWAQDLHDRWRAEVERSTALRYQLEAVTVAVPADDPAPDLAALQRDRIRIARLTDYRPEDWTGGEPR